MRERLERVLTKLLLPMFDRLESVSVSIMGFDNHIYRITFYFNDRIDTQDAWEIQREVSAIFEMLSPAKNEDFVIRYERGESFSDI